VKHLAIVALLAGTASADGAFCEVTPCLEGPVTRRMLAKDELIGRLWCAKGSEAGVDPKGRLQFCTTARALDVDGLRVAKGAYTLVHPNGHIYQTTLRDARDFTLADKSTVRCGAELIAMSDDGHVTYCKLAAARPGTPRARVGEGISLFPDGRVQGVTLDESYTVGVLTLPPGASVVWDAAGHAIGGFLKDAMAVGALSIFFDYTLYPSGKLHDIELAAKTTIAGHEFPEFAKLELRETGTLAAARYISDRGFMIHGEEWTDTTVATYDAAGHVVTTSTSHYQSDVRPPKFK
jgi:hypothetical protein